MVVSQELVRFERLADKRYPVAETHPFLHLPRNDAYGRLAARPRWLYVFATGIIAYAIRVSDGHVVII
jgi:hypothetical protein